MKKRNFLGLLGIGFRFVDIPNCTFLSIDVECVATSSDDRAVASVAICNENEEIIFSVIVKQLDVIDYRTHITGFSEGSLDEELPFDDAVGQIKQFLGPNIIIIGQSVQNDIGWLKLVRGIDFYDYVDISYYFMQSYRNHGASMKKKFSLRNEVEVLLDIKVPKVHTANDDTIYAMKLFKEYLLHGDDVKLRAAKHKLFQTKWRDVASLSCETTKPQATSSISKSQKRIPKHDDFDPTGLFYYLERGQGLLYGHECDSDEIAMCFFLGEGRD